MKASDAGLPVAMNAGEFPSTIKIVVMSAGLLSSESVNDVAKSSNCAPSPATWQGYIAASIHG
jgi:hypothetical protein